MYIRTISLAAGFALAEMDALLRAEGIRRDRHLDYACGLYDDEENLLAAGGCFQNTIRCLAVDSRRRGEGLLVQLLSHLLAEQARRGNLQVFLYTKPENAAFFSGLGFYEVARTDRVLFLENRRQSLQTYCDGLRRSSGGRIAAVVMNANPFTLGHRHLLERACAENDVVHLFLLSQEAGPIPAAVRKKLVQAGIGDLDRVILHETGPYLISSATFPGYFFRDDDEAIRAQAGLDLAVFAQIAGTLGIQRRYVGEEPASHVTGLYNQAMLARLPAHGVECVVIPRLAVNDRIVSASAVRRAIQENDRETLAQMLPETTLRYLSSPEAESVLRAIRQEKDVIHY